MNLFSLLLLSALDAIAYTEITHHSEEDVDQELFLKRRFSVGYDFDYSLPDDVI